MPRNNQYLIISQSGRALASSARRAGINPHVIDFFADEDTIENTVSNYSVTGFSGGNNPQRLLDTVARYFGHIQGLQIVIGSGFEDNPRLLTELAQQYPVIANDASVVRQVKDPITFFSKLKHLDLPYPEYFLQASEAVVRKTDLLKKKIGSAGGVHVSLFETDMTLDSDCYLQTLVEGNNYSVTFIADGSTFHVLGFNETWICKNSYSFAGAISNADLADECCCQIVEAIRQLVPAFKLCGLCSLDFIVNETGQCSILEINPRPTATYELYEQQGDLFLQHLAAFSGNMLKPDTSRLETRALGVLYAEESITIPRLEWPHWVSDRPIPGKLIAKGEPVCTIHAAGETAENVKVQLLNRLSQQRQTLGMTLVAA